MQVRAVNSTEAPAAQGGYAQALEVAGAKRLLFVSGQIPKTRGGEVPCDFMAQCELAWRNVLAQVKAAGMTVDNLVKVTTFLSDRRFAIENREVRQRMLEGRSPALTVIICDIFDEAWLLEIEAVAAA